MSLFTEILDACADQLKANITPPSGVDLHIEPRAFAIAEAPAVDMFVMNPTGLEEGLAGFGSHTRYGAFPITIRVRVSTADIYAGEDLLLGLIDDDGPLSIIAALDADRTLGGVIDTLTWGNGFPWTGYQDFPMSDGNGILLGSTMAVVVVKPQS